MSRVPRGLESFLRSLALMRLLQAQGNASPTVNQQLFLTLDHMTQIEKEYKYKSGIAIKSHACHIIPTKTKYIHSLGVSVLVFASLPFLDFFGFFGDLAGFLGLVPLEALGFWGPGCQHQTRQPFATTRPCAGKWWNYVRAGTGEQRYGTWEQDTGFLGARVL